jgi:hypothetical protein
MTGYPDFNYSTFRSVTTFLRGVHGLHVVSPHECPPPAEGLGEEAVWDYYMEKCFEMMEQCNAIALLQGWPESRGARLELNFALDKGWPVYNLHSIGGKYLLFKSSRRDQHGSRQE